MIINFSGKTRILDEFKEYLKNIFRDLKNIVTHKINLFFWDNDNSTSL